MNVVRKDVDSVNLTLTVQIEKNDYQDRVAKSLKDIRKKAELPGFRAGMAPASFIQKKYGKAVLAEEINKILSESLYGYIQENKLSVLGEPLPNETEQKEINFDAQESFEFVFDVAIAPEFELELNKKDKLKEYTVAIDEKMIKGSMDMYADRFGKQESVEGPVIDNDVVKGLLVENKEGGILVEEAVLSPRFMKDKTEKAKFSGINKGDAVKFNPKKAFESASEIASLLKITKEEAEKIDADFTFTLKEITRFTPGEINQELFDKVYGKDVVKSEEEFKAKVAEELKQTYALDSEYRLLMDARDLALKKMEKLVFPDDFLKRWVVASNENMTIEKVEENYSKMLEDLKWQLAKEKLATKNNVKVEDADVKEMLKKIARMQFAQYGMTSVPDDVIANYADSMMKDKEATRNAVARIMDEKIAAIIKDAVKVEAKEVSLDEFNKLF